MACNEWRRVQAYLDGEAADADAIEQHLELCAECAAGREDLLAIRRDVRQGASYHRVGQEMRGKLGRALDSEARSSRPPILRTRAFWAGSFSGALAAGCAALLAVFLVLPPQSEMLTDDILADHLRSLMPNHLVDVESSNHHTVKPWFAGRVDVSPPVADFAHEGYTLVGGRADIVDGRRAAVTIYRHGAHIINVFAWPAFGAPLPGIETRNGYHFVYWKDGNIAFCAVSDTALDELLGLVRMLKAMAAPDSRE
jgi:anti-sigma factor RsiW